MIVVLLGLAVVGCASSEDEAESVKKRCSTLRDHIIELRLAAANDKIDVKGHREALKHALGASSSIAAANDPSKRSSALSL